MVLSQSTMHKGKHLFLFLLSLVTVPKSCISMLEDGYFLQLSRLRLRSPHQLSFSMFKETECCLRCLQYTGCKSVNFDMRDGTCEINFFGPQSHGVKTEVNQFWALYYKPNGKKRVICFYVLSFFFSNYNAKLFLNFDWYFFYLMSRKYWRKLRRRHQKIEILWKKWNKYKLIHHAINLFNRTYMIKMSNYICLVAPDYYKLIIERDFTKEWSKVTDVTQWILLLMDSVY